MATALSLGLGRLANDPLGAYKPHDLDQSAAVQYFGYADIRGKWYIMKMNTSDDTLRYVHGASGYVTAWTARVSQSYGYFFA